MLTPLDAGEWPEYCARMRAGAWGVSVFGVGFSDGHGRIDEVRAIELRPSDAGLAPTTIRVGWWPERTRAPRCAPRRR